jgi:hypothetical protein
MPVLMQLLMPPSELERHYTMRFLNHVAQLQLLMHLVFVQHSYHVKLMKPTLRHVEPPSSPGLARLLR